MQPRGTETYTQQNFKNTLTVCAFNECELSRWFISIQRQLISIFSVYDHSDVAQTFDCKVQTLIQFFFLQQNITILTKYAKLAFRNIALQLCGLVYLTL